MSVLLKNAIRRVISHINGILRKPVYPREDFATAKSVSCSRESVEVLSSSTVVLHIASADTDGYFFECRKHSSLQEYVNSFIEDYYTFIIPSQPENEADRQLVISSLVSPHNFQKFISMGMNLYGLKSPCMEFLSTGQGSVVGLNTDPNNQAQIQRLKNFIGKYAWCQLNSYSINRHAAPQCPQTRETNIALSVQALAGLLGLEHMIPSAKYIRLEVQGCPARFGLFVQSAEGCSILPFSSAERKQKITPAFQRELLSLNALDVVVLDQDHSPNNYNVIMDENGFVTGVSAFDNKSAGAFSLHPKIDFVTYKNCSPFIRKDGTINRPHLSRRLAGQISGLTYSVFYSALKAYLTPVQVLFAWIRLVNLKKAINKTQHIRSSFLLDDCEWSQATLDAELSGDFGKTYLISFYSDVFLY